MSCMIFKAGVLDCQVNSTDNTDNDNGLLVFRVYYERPMVINSLNLKLSQIARFSSNVILDEMSSAKCRLYEERPLYHIHMVTSRLRTSAA